MSVPLSQVLTTARTYLNDDNATQFPDPVLIPKSQEAHRELQENLWAIGSPLVRAQVQLTVPALTGVLNPTTVASFPTDLLCPTVLTESPTNGGPYVPMTEVFFLGGIELSPTALQRWCWLQEQLLVQACVSIVYITLQYRRQIPIPQLTTDLIGVLFGESYLAARTAAIAAGSVGSKDILDSMTSLANANLSKVIMSNRGQQKPLIQP